MLGCCCGCVAACLVAAFLLLPLYGVTHAEGAPKAAGYTLQEIKAAGYSCAEARAAGYPRQSAPQEYTQRTMYIHP